MCFKAHCREVRTITNESQSQFYLDQAKNLWMRSSDGRLGNMNLITHILLRLRAAFSHRLQFLRLHDVSLHLKQPSTDRLCI